MSGWVIWNESPVRGPMGNLRPSLLLVAEAPSRSPKRKEEQATRGDLSDVDAPQGEARAGAVLFVEVFCPTDIFRARLILKTSRSFAVISRPQARSQ